MSQPVQSEQVTRLLIQKRGEYAELEEMARIAVSVLQDDGWSVERIGTEIAVTVTRAPILQPGLSSALTDAELKFAALRGEVEALHAENIAMRRRAWLAAAVACLVCCLLSALHIPVVMTAPGAACGLVWRFYKYRRAKGAK